MKLTDRRFWIFESWTVVYAAVLLWLAGMVYGKTSAPEVRLFVVGVCCVSGFFAWLLGEGRHWLVFGLIYEGVLLFLTSVCLWVMACDVIDMLDVYIFFAIVAMLGIISILPTFALAFFGYRMFQKRGGKSV